MARQPKTAPPKTKFSTKTYTCYSCQRKTDVFRLKRINGVAHTVCPDHAG